MGLSLVSDGQPTLLAYGLTAIGAITFLRTAHGILSPFVNAFIRRGESLSKYGAKKGAYAVVTGATQGIGLAFAQQLAKAGFNIFLISRTQETLNQVASDIESKYPTTKTKTFAIDFAKTTPAQLAQLESELSPLDIGVLVNNVGISHSFPIPFEEITEETINDMININILAQIRVTKMIITGMIQRRRGLIMNLGSLAGYLPSALLSVYGGTKGFLRLWSQALGEEVKGKGIRVELINAAFVVSSLSKIRKPKWDVPTPDVFVRAALRSIGIGYTEPFLRSPFWAHGVTQWVADHVGSKSLWVTLTYKMHIDIRKRALKKQQRLAAEASSNGDKKKDE